MLNTPQVEKKLKRLNDGCRNVITSHQGGKIQALGNEGSTGEVCGLRASKCQRVGEELVSIKPGHASSAFRAEYDEDQIAGAYDKRHSAGQSYPKRERPTREGEKLLRSLPVDSRCQSASWGQNLALPAS